MADIFPTIEGEIAVVVSQNETDPTVPDCVKAITEADIEKWNNIEYADSTEIDALFSTDSTDSTTETEATA